jgi:hypothetical protein
MPLRCYSAEASIRHRSRYIFHTSFSRKEVYIIWSHFATNCQSQPLEKFLLNPKRVPGVFVVYNVQIDDGT